MYNIRPESIKTFLEDKTIRLPRFQRKQTWDEKKNFKLIVSLFKGFPLGVVVINIQFDEKSRRHTKWLLDGRQRKNALHEALTDPEIIYSWAKKFLKFKTSIDPADLITHYWDEIEKYLGEEKENEEVEQAPVINEEEQDIYESEDAENTESSSSPFKRSVIELDDKYKKYKDLDFLLEFLIACHKKTPFSSNLTKPFDFSKFINNLDWIEIQNGKKVSSSKKLKTWLNEYRSHCENNDIEYININTFYEYLIKRYSYVDKQNKLIIHIKRYWDFIDERIALMDRLQTKLQEAKIGLIELDNMDASDAQTTFMLINSGGELLTSTEILSAKPRWNIPVKNPSSSLSESVKRLYAEIGVQQDNVVRWDVPATLTQRIDGLDFIIKKFDASSKSEFSKRLTFGFKLLSANFCQGITKNDIDKLSEVPGINWDTEIDTIISELNQLGKILLTFDMFRYFKSWGWSLMELTSDAVAINFLILLYLDYKRKGQPVGINVNMKQFMVNSYVLLDKMFYEYLTRAWRGPGDAKLSKNLINFSTLPEIFEPIETEKWIDLINEVVDEHAITTSPLNTENIDTIMKPLLLYMYVLDQKAAPNDPTCSIEIDHIIPKSLIASSLVGKKDKTTNNIGNLAFLPKKENISKSDKILSDIKNQWMKDSITTYTGIKEDEFQKFSSTSSISDLISHRKNLFIKIFTTKRTEILDSHL